MKKLGAWKSVVVIAAAYLALGLVAPGRFAAALTVSGSYVREMALIIPAVVLLMGLFEVWVPKEMIQRLLGRGAGVRGFVLAFFMGTAPTGPLYVAFPLAAALMQKGASPANIMVFLGAWAAAKVPQVAMEAKFLGLGFAITRLTLTAVSLVVMGLLGQALLARLSTADRSRATSALR
jgi:uncharacterized membrane protein YraQ (UPF0718 family)